MKRLERNSNKRLSRTVRGRIALIVLAFISILIAVTYFILKFSPYPEYEEFLNQSYSTSFYDRKGNLLQVTTVENGLRREWTSLDEIPDDVKKIFIEAEDKRFFSHGGIDIFSIANAVFQNISAGRTVRGASTITMQLVKQIDAKNNNKENSTRRTAAQKISDAVNALRLECRLSKNKILEYYLNNVPFGMGAEGVTSAARSFFGCELSELNEDQIKCLSVIIRRPNLYNPVINPELCAERAGVPVEVAETAKLYDYPFLLPHYIEYLKNTGENGDKFNSKIYTSVDLELQKKSEGFLRNAMLQATEARISNGAFLVIDNYTGDVLAWAGNSDWFDQEHHGQIDGVLVENQPGSSMKPFLYALALDIVDEKNVHKFYPSKILADVPKEFGSQNLYIPANFNNRFNGPVRFRISLASSLNIPAVALLNDIGVNEYLDKLYELGFESLRKNGKKADLGLALGAGEVSLYELVRGFSIFPRDGINFEGKEVYSKDTSRLICSILSDASARALGFGYTQTFQTDYPSIFKTGTANQYQNIVALGATKNYTVGVWMGNFEGQTVVGKTGSSLPASVAKQILDFMESGKSVSDLQFEEPELWHKEKICSVSGLPAGDNCPAIIHEYMYDGDKVQKCNWHQVIDGEPVLVYPAEFQSWVLQNNINVYLDHESVPLTIITPNNEALFYYSEQNSEMQKIQVEVIGGTADSALIEYDEKPYCEARRPFVFSLPVERGKHKFSVTCGIEEISHSFEVK